MRVLSVLCVLSVLSVGCSNAPYKSPPSTAPAQQSINSASAENNSAIEHNRKARNAAELIDNKASVIERFWK